jgi:tetratricopeptide (TPR) repeat protein
VWRELGYDGKARLAAKAAYDVRASLPQENQLVIEAQYRETTGQWEQAIRAYRTLFEQKGPRLDYGLSLAAAQTRAGDVKAAYATLDKLRKLPPPIGTDPRIELADAAAAEAADDIERMRVSAEKAARMAKQRNARLLYAKALFREGWALWTLGDDTEADRVYHDAQRLFVELGDVSGLARTLNNLALADHRKHRDREATETFAKALALATSVDDTQAQAWVLNNWAYVLADAGDLPRALELDQQKLNLGAERGVQASSLAAAHVNIAEILRWRGDLAGARDHCETAQNLLRGLDARRFAAHGAYQCGAIDHAEDDLEGAKKWLDQAMIWASDVMTPAEAAEIRIEMARVALDAGRAAESETLARAASADLRTANEGSQQVCAIAVLAASLLAQHRTTEAAHTIAATASLPSEGVSFACRLEAELVGARVTVASDPATRADVLRHLEDVRRRAATATFVQLELQARLALGELAGTAGRAPLRTLAAEARKLGFTLLARKADHELAPR